MSVEKLKLFHEEIMQEEGIKLADLPKEIQRQINGFNTLLKRYKSNPEDEKLFVLLQKNAIKIGDNIQDFIEQDFDEEDEEEEEVKKPASNKKSSKEEEEEEEDDDDDDEKSKKPSKNKEEKPAKREGKKTGGFGNLMMEKKILSIMESRGEKRIRISDLESIIGREPDYPEQVVNNIKLRKVFLSSDYRLV